MKRTKFLLRFAVITLAALLLVISCAAFSACEPEVPVTGISLDKTELTLLAGDEAQLTAIVAPADTTDKHVTWESSDEAVVTVEDGKLKAVGSGNAVITAAAGDCFAECKITVEALIEWDDSWLNGEVLNLDDAYELGYISDEDLPSMAYYFNGGREENEDLIPEDFVPQPKNPRELNEAIESEIKLGYYRKKYHKPDYEKDWMSSDLIIETYCGTYGNCIVVKFIDGMIGIPAVYPYDTDGTFYINGFCFPIHIPQFALVWRKL